MKLSEIVRYRNNLDEIAPSDIESLVSSVLDPVIYAVDVNEMKLPHRLQSLIENRQDVLSSIKDFRETLSTIKQDVDRAIENMEPTYLANSYRLYQSMQNNDSVEYTLNRKLQISQAAENYIRARVQMYSDWKHTGAVIRPGLETLIDLMVGCNPLYVIDTDHGFFDPIKQRFNELFVNRLCFYKIQESDQPGFLQNLPDNQFGFVLAYNFFHYKPFEIFKNYLTEIYTKLAPGGCLAFTFNDCTRWGGVDLTERWYMCYTPGRLVRSLCENLGYEIINTYIIDNASTWLEIRKPGSRTSLRGGQALARIVEKSK